MRVGKHFKIICLLAMGLVTCITSLPAYSATDILGFRLSDSRKRARLVFDLSGPAEHSLFTLSSPERVVIDIENVQSAADLPAKVPSIDVIRGIRSALRDGGTLRVVLDLKEKVRPKSFLLQPAKKVGHRLVIDLYNEGPRSTPKAKKTIPKPRQLRDVVIAVDAGHGGKDPGAVGKRGTYEKHVALAMAKELARQINQERGMRAVLTRKGDYYVKLRDRIEKARQAKADLFISIHADAFKDRHAHGSSVYALSLSGATSEAAQLLANRENAADLIDGVSLEDKDPVVRSVLLDLSQNATINASLDVGSQILESLGQYNNLHKPSVQQAGFIVLKSPTIPSVLVETAFISNPSEERKLTSKQYQRRTAQSIFSGIKLYFARKAPPGTLLAEENRRLRSGDKLTANW